jgi:hypothetical protein
MFLRPRSVAIAVALVAVPASAGLALAGNNGDRPRTDPVRAKAVLSRSDLKMRTCQGQDGPYGEFRGTVGGPSTGDPRLTGTLEARIHDLINLHTFDGVLRGEVVIRGAAGREKVEGHFNGVDDPIQTAGFLRGEARRNQAKNLPGGELFGNVRITFPQGKPPEVHLGGASTNNLIPAVIQKGHCTGPFHRATVQDAASGRAGRAVARWGGLAK